MYMLNFRKMFLYSALTNIELVSVGRASIIFLVSQRRLRHAVVITTPDIKRLFRTIILR